MNEKEERLLESFSELILRLSESPQINSFLSKDVMNKISHSAIAEIEGLPHKINLGNNQYHAKNKEYHYYWHEINHKPTEYSRVEIKSNIQKTVSKQDGSVQKLYDQMAYHIRHYGELVTDSSHTKGSRLLWINFIKLHPEFKYEKIHNDERELIHNIDEFKDKLWNKHFDYTHIKIRAFS